jgi:hypothetical protein
MPNVSQLETKIWLDSKNLQMLTLPSAVVLNRFNASICQVYDEAMHKQLLYEIKYEN